MKSKGFGLISLIITIAIIALLVFGFSKFHGTDKNQIQAGQDAIDRAKNAAAQEKAANQDLQNQIQQPDLAPDVYHSIQDRAKSLK
jgi:hypothetical protein